MLSCFLFLLLCVFPSSLFRLALAKHIVSQAPYLPLWLPPIDSQAFGSDEKDRVCACVCGSHERRQDSSSKGRAMMGLSNRNKKGDSRRLAGSKRGPGTGSGPGRELWDGQTCPAEAKKGAKTYFSPVLRTHHPCWLAVEDPAFWRFLAWTNAQAAGARRHVRGAVIPERIRPWVDLFLAGLDGGPSKGQKRGERGCRWVGRGGLSPNPCPAGRERPHPARRSF